MSWFSEQINTRRRLDEQGLEDSYARLAASVVGSGRAPSFTLDDAAAADDAVSAVLAFYGQKPADIPEDVTDPMERIDCALRPTGVMKRPVRLEGAWWRNAPTWESSRTAVSSLLFPCGCVGMVTSTPRPRRKWS